MDMNLKGRVAAITGGGGAIADDIVGAPDSMFRDIAINFYNKFASMIVDQKIFRWNCRPSDG